VCFPKREVDQKTMSGYPEPRKSNFSMLTPGLSAHDAYSVFFGIFGIKIAKAYAEIVFYLVLKPTYGGWIA